VIAGDFITIRDFSPQQISALLELAGLVKAAPDSFSNALQGKTLAMIFEKPSLRTRITYTTWKVSATSTAWQLTLP
jgi:ornithine carbamoyltransferase